MLKKYTALITAACAVLLTFGSCAFPTIDDSPSESEAQTESAAQRVIETTKTATFNGKYDKDDEDYEGYTTTTSVTAGTLENDDVSIDDGYDWDIIATATKRTTTTSATTISETTATKKTTTTKFKKDALYPLTDELKYPDSIPYKVKSDTTYLNLRFGPSKKYDVQIQIPDGKNVTGSGEKSDSDGNIWVYVTYEKNEGWVMKELLGTVG